MKLWLILILLSLLAYFMVRRSLKGVTTTPVWLCWLVLMLPAFIWTAWTFAFGTEQPLPLAIFLFPLIICPILYGWLVQKGKPEPEKTSRMSKIQEEDKTTMAKPVPKTSPPPRLINRQEENTLRNCFPWNIYYLQNIDNRPQAIFCRGKLKTMPEKAYKEVKQNVEKAFGDRFFLIFQESFRGKPFFALVPNPQPQVTSKQDKNFVVAIGMFLVTFATTTFAGASIGAASPEEILVNFNLLLSGLVYSLPLLLILGIRELVNYFTARHYQIRTTLPYFIPFPSFFFDSFSLGTLGAFTQKRSPIPHRQALFDVAAFGSLLSFFATIVVLIGGLSLSTVTTLEDSAEFSFNAFDPRLSLLLSFLAKLALGSSLEAGIGIDLHPLAAAGCIGLLFAIIDLMPIGQLDGGHIVHAVFGQRMAIAVGQITRILAILFALVHPYFLIWAIILWFIPLIDRPALNDVTELNNWRDALGLLAIALFVVAILPLPTTVAGWLGM